MVGKHDGCQGRHGGRISSLVTYTESIIGKHSLNGKWASARKPEGPCQ